MPRKASKSLNGPTQHRIAASVEPAIRLRLDSPNSKVRTIKFGAFVAELPVPSNEIVKRNVAAGRAAMKRLRSALLTPGVKLHHPKSVPLYVADPNDPSGLIELRGRKRTRGRFSQGGKFIAAK